jgi:hypothetical protein
MILFRWLERSLLFRSGYDQRSSSPRGQDLAMPGHRSASILHNSRHLVVAIYVRNIVAMGASLLLLSLGLIPSILLLSFKASESLH